MLGSQPREAGMKPVSGRPQHRSGASRARSVESGEHGWGQEAPSFSRAASASVDLTTSPSDCPRPTARLPERAHSTQLGFIRQQQTHSNVSRLDISQALLSKVPGSWAEREMPCAKWRKYDKAFACDWLSERLVVLGTKCNQLLLLDTVTSKVQEVSLPSTGLQRAPPQSAQQADGAQQDASPRPSAQSCGIHAVSLSPDGTRLATGGAHPNDCQVFDVYHSPSSPGGVHLSPVQTLVDHSDWIFGLSWVTTCHVVTGSRDRTIKLWQVDQSMGSVNRSPLQTCLEQAGKVRDVKFSLTSGRVATLAVEGTLHLWDPHLTSVSSVHVGHTQEVVCMGEAEGLLAVGSHSHVTLVDPRAQLPVKDIVSQEPNHGVRSVCFRQHLLSAGSGHGQLSFYDLRADAYVQMEPVGKSGQKARSSLQIGSGWLSHDAIYRQYFQDTGPIANACYAHAWNATSTQLFCAGGPLAFGLKGSYMGLWA